MIAGVIVDPVIPNYCAITPERICHSSGDEPVPGLPFMPDFPVFKGFQGLKLDFQPRATRRDSSFDQRNLRFRCRSHNIEKDAILCAHLRTVRGSLLAECGDR